MIKRALNQRYHCQLVVQFSRRFSASNGTGDGSSENDTEKQRVDKLEKLDSPELQAKKQEAKEKLSNLLSSLSKKSAAKEDVKVKIPPVKLSQPSSVKTPKISPALKKEYKKIDPTMASAIKSVSDEVGGGSETETALLDSLKKITDTSAPTTDIKNVLSGLQVRSEPQVSRSKSKPKSSWVSTTNIEEKVNLFGAEPLGIFSVPPEGTDPPVEQAPVNLPTWDKLQADAIADSVSQPPANHFQELINWTRQGKVWKFPIDNEVGLDAEKAVGFHEHIFLERHLAGWCPTTGPIRHFMELVCVGLSKNPHITADRKKNVIVWYKDFFESKRSLLEEVGAYKSKKEGSPEL